MGHTNHPTFREDIDKKMTPKLVISPDMGFEQVEKQRVIGLLWWGRGDLPPDKWRHLPQSEILLPVSTFSNN